MIRVEIWQEEGGHVQCRSWMDDTEPTGKDVVTLVGMIETAKLSLLNGRWGLMASKEAKLGIGFPPVDYVQKTKKAKKTKRE